MSSYKDYLAMSNYMSNPAIAPTMFNQTAGSFPVSDMSSLLNYENPEAKSNFRISELAQAPMTNAATAALDMPASMGLWGDIGKWAKDSGFVGSKNANGMETGGWGAPAIQGVSGLMNAFMGMKNYGMSKDIFNNNKQQFERNFSAQKGITNSQLSDRQERRVADAQANGINNVTSVADYMSKWGVK